MQILDRDILTRALLLGMMIALIGLSALPHKVEQTFLQTRQSLEAGNLNQAAINFANIADFFPWWSTLWLYAGRYASQGGEPQAAIEYFHRYGTVDDLSLEDQILLVDAYLQIGDLTNAEQILQHAENSRTSSKEIYERLAEIHRIQNDFTSLTDDLKSLFTLQPNNAHLAYELGLLLSTQDPGSALSYLEEAANQDPKFTDSALKLQREIITARVAEEPAYTLLSAGRSLAVMDEWKLATQAFQQATQTRPDYAEAWAFLGEAKQHFDLTGGNNIAEPVGLSDLETALQIDPRSIIANVLMGIYWQRQNQFNQALKYIRTASNLDPKNPMLHTELGMVLAKTGDLKNAQVQYERAIELSPQDPTYWRLLAEFSLHYQLQIRQVALPAARQAVILSSNDPQSLDVIGQVLILLGDNLTAERYLRRALETNNQYALAHLHLGVVYMNQGDAEHARLHFDLAKNVAPNSWTFEQAARLIGYYFP